MAEKTWVEQAIDRFFESRKSPTRSQCDQLALSLSGSSAVRSVDVPGSLSYTVLCTATQSRGRHDEQAIVVSFRESESGLDKTIGELAVAIHEGLIPRATDHGIMDASDPPLGIYTMPFLPGVAYLEVLSCEPEMEPDEEAKHVCFMKHLARYFARCWSTPQHPEPQLRAECHTGISRRLALLKASSSAVPISMLSELEGMLPILCSSTYPQVLAHGDLSMTNILVDPDIYEISGIIDWSLAGLQPFGLELDCLFLMTGYMDLSGWHDYSCQIRLWDAFWDEFWAALEFEEADALHRTNIRRRAEAAAKIGAVLRYGFDRNPDGSPSEVLTTSQSMLKMLKAWFDE